MAEVARTWELSSVEGVASGVRSLTSTICYLRFIVSLDKFSHVIFLRRQSINIPVLFS